MKNIVGSVALVVFLSLVLEVALGSRRGIGGFSVELIHRDSPHSPFFDPSKTDKERLMGAFRRGRAGRFRSTTGIRSAPGVIQSALVPLEGEYVMNLSIGTPPVPFMAIVDTGSDLTWTQCRPCDKCYKQEIPLFDPRKSSTYQDSSCETSFCLSLGIDGSCSTQQRCEFSYDYLDDSFASGNLATETLSVVPATGNQATFPGFAFGCAHIAAGLFDAKSSGIVGLGRGELSMISQLESTINGRFSYCLQPLSSNSTVSGRFNFGTSDVVSGSGSDPTVSTPLFRKAGDTYYYLTLEGFSVAKKKMIPYKTFLDSSKKAPLVEDGNIIVDSGTTLTYIREEFYRKVEISVANSIKGEKRVKDPSGIFSLCYNSTREIVNLPIITVHFKDADVELRPLNTFIRVNDDLICFTIVPTSDVGVFGNIAQVNFLVGFDLGKKRVSLKPTDCTLQTAAGTGLEWVVTKIIILNLILYGYIYKWI